MFTKACYLQRNELLREHSRVKDSMDSNAHSSHCNIAQTWVNSRMENAAVAANKIHKKKSQQKVSFLLTSIQAGSWNPTYYAVHHIHSYTIYAQSPTQMTAPRSSLHFIWVLSCHTGCNVTFYHPSTYLFWSRSHWLLGRMRHSVYC